jgi:hypothetical protein
MAKLRFGLGTQNSSKLVFAFSSLWTVARRKKTFGILIRSLNDKWGCVRVHVMPEVPENVFSQPAGALHLASFCTGKAIRLVPWETSEIAGPGIWGKQKYQNPQILIRSQCQHFWNARFRVQGFWQKDS